MAVSLADAVITLIRAGLPAGVPVYDGVVPDDGMEGEPPARYVVLWMPNATRGTEAVSAQSTDRGTRFQTTSVAPDRGMAAWLSNRVCDALVDAVPEVDGWTRAPIQHVLSYQPETQDLVLARRAVAVMDRFEHLADYFGVAGS